MIKENALPEVSHVSVTLSVFQGQMGICRFNKGESGEWVHSFLDLKAERDFWRRCPQTCIHWGIRCLNVIITQRCSGWQPRKTSQVEKQSLINNSYKTKRARVEEGPLLN